MAPCPSLSQRAEEVWDLFGESMTSAPFIDSMAGMQRATLAPNRSTAATLAEACGIRPTAEWWFLYGDLERAWVSIVNEKKPEE